MPTYVSNEAQTEQITEQATQGVKRKGDYLPEDGLAPANKKLKTQANDVMSSSELYVPLKTNEVVTEVKALLHQCYQAPAYAELKRLLHERNFPITESFINLAIVKEQEQKPKEDEQLKAIKTLSRDEYLNSFEMIYQSKTPIKIEDLLLAQDEENQVPKRQLIEGRAGIGKTTLCQYLAHQWAAANSKWDAWRQQFDWVIHLSLRQLTADEQYDFSKLTLANWIYKLYLTSVVQQSFTEAEFVEAWHTLNAQGRVLLLLDGYDEIVPALKINLSLQRFFEQTLLSSTYWFIFSRPYYFMGNSVERRLENIGFTQHDIFNYVQQYFCDIEKEKHISQQTYADSLISYLKQNPNAKGIAHIPINLELLCYTWESGKNSPDNQLTLTQLYNHLVLSLFGRYLHKYFPKDIASPSGITWNDLQTDTEYNCQQMLAFLEQLAWHQMQESGLIISVDIIKKLVSDLYPNLKQKSQREAFGEMVLKQLGLLKGCNVHKPVLEQSYYFIHLTFQEYFAALHWFKLFQGEENEHAEAIQLLRKNKFNPRYEIVWWMVAGLLKDDRAHLTAFFELLKQAPRDLAGLNQQLLQLRCLEECNLNLSESKKIKLLTELVQWINYEIVTGEGYSFNFITTYLGMSSQVFQQEMVRQVFTTSLKDKYKAVNCIKILAKQFFLPPEIIDQLLKLLKDEDSYLSFVVATVLNQQRNSLPNDALQELDLLLGINEKYDWGVPVANASSERSLPLENKEWNISDNPVEKLYSPAWSSEEYLESLGRYAFKDTLIIAKDIKKLTIKCLIETIKGNLLSAKLKPFLCLLFLKSHQKKLPIYFVDHEQASGKFFLKNGESELHIGNVWQGTFTYQQKRIFIKAFHRVFSKMTGILPDLSLLSLEELQDFKNFMTGRMLTQARTLFQFTDQPYTLNFMADQGIVSRILFFTPAGQVLDSSQQEKVIDYAKDRKNLNISAHKTTFWQLIGISNDQSAENVVNNSASKELEDSKQPKALEIKK